ncbi:hypothetical protein GCM10027596_02620 [Nocardioides korecus]
MDDRENAMRESLWRAWSYSVGACALRIGGRRYDLDHVALGNLARDLVALRRTTPPATVAARVLIQVSRSRVVTIEGDEDLTRCLAIQAALFVCADLLSVRGRRLDLGGVPELRRLLLREPITRRDLKSLLERIVIRAAPRPVLALLTPISQLDGDGPQQRLLAVADRLDDSPVANAYRIVVPGRDLHPDDEIVGDRHERALDERRLVVGATVVVVVAAEHDSWGASKCVAWAESVNIPTLVYTTRPEDLSRVLSNDVPTTRYLPFDTIEGVASDIVERVQSLGDLTATRHSQRLLHDKIGQSLHRLFVRTRRVREDVPPGLMARARAVSTSGDDALTLTLTELLALRGHFPDFVDDLLNDLFPREHSDGDDPALTSGLHFDDLQYFCENRRLSSSELVAMLREYSLESQGVAGALRRRVTPTYLDQLLGRVRRK